MPSPTGIIKYANTVRRLFPLGKVWEEALENAFPFLRGMAAEFCRVDERGRDLLRQLDPLTADLNELLADWEALLNLPDDCAPGNQTLAQRQLQAWQALGAQG